MDDLPQNKKPNSGANAAPARIMGSSSSESNSNVAFKSDYIGQWAAKQDDPFAEQNRKAAAEKAAKDAARKKVMPYIKIGSIIAAAAAVLAVIIVVIVVIATPKPITTLTPEESTSFQEEAQKIFDRHTQNIDLSNTENLTDREKEDIEKALEEVGKYYERQADRAENNEAQAQVTMEEMSFYLWNNQPEAALKASEKISTEGLTSDTLSNFYGMMQSTYYVLGDMEQAERYFNLMVETIGEENYVAG